jgi:hypothetical protein
MTTIKTPGRVALMAAASVLALSTAVGADTIRFWTTEEQPERLATATGHGRRLHRRDRHRGGGHPRHRKRSRHARHGGLAAGDLPDVIYHTLQYALPWYEAGILDADAATEVIEAPGAPRPSPPARWRWRGRRDGYASVPVDGWTQMIVYRADLFEEPGWSRRPPTPTCWPRSRRCTTRRRCSASSPPPRSTRTSCPRCWSMCSSPMASRRSAPTGSSRSTSAATTEVLEFYKRHRRGVAPRESCSGSSRASSTSRGGRR